MVDMWSARSAAEENEDDDDESFLSCDSDVSSDDEYHTPPQSPIKFDDTDDEDMNMFEESLEHLENEKEYSLYIYG